MNEKQRFSPETGKPNPVSLREYMLMDRHEQRAYMKPLSKKERYDFQIAALHGVINMPLSEKRTIQKEIVAKLEARTHMSIGDKIELVIEKLRDRQLQLPEKKPILFRKLRTKPMAVPKAFGSGKSPFLISSGI